MVVLTLDGLDTLIRGLAASGYEVLGPTLHSGAVMPGPVSGVTDLPKGMRDEQVPGRYRLLNEGDERLFAWAVGPGSWKSEFFPAVQEVWRAGSVDGSFAFREPVHVRRPVALVGMRPCEFAALGVLDRVLRDGEHPDPRYRAHRDALFSVVAECTYPASTCFCSSMDTGPAIDSGFDLAMTEVVDSGGHRFIVRVGSSSGVEALSLTTSRAASDQDLRARERALAGGLATMDRRLATEGLAQLIATSIEHPLWDEVAERCLSCANCTMVCPTCFCSDVHDTTDLAGDVTRRRTWSSCFDIDHSYLHGGPVRESTSSRYRQWMTHKLSTWWDQFATSGCVGCGRCVTWCPVGIDITEEAGRLRSLVAVHSQEVNTEVARS